MDAAIKARRIALWSELMNLKSAHGALQRTGFSIKTGSAGCGLSRNEITERCAAIRLQMDAVRAQIDALNATAQGK